MTLYAIGMPGQIARMYLDDHGAADPDNIARQLIAYEVAVPVDAMCFGLSISADGKSIVTPAAPSGRDIEVIAARNGLLRASDWTMVQDAPLSADQKEAWSAYRQALRDLPEQQPDATLQTVVWPEVPA